MASELDLLETYKKIKDDPWEFCSRCVFTLDEADKKHPIKPFPSHYKYLKYYVRIWQKTDRLVVPKSRRMFISWVNIALFLWDTMFNIGRNNAFVSKKEDDANDLLKRAKFIYDHIPESIIPKDLLPKIDQVYGSLRFPELDSVLRGFPQGADQLRQFTFSRILGDEMAFWEQAQLMYAASLPTLEGGGQFVGVSSPAPGFFKRLVFDSLDDEESDANIAPQGSADSDRFPMEGVEVWKNPKNKFVVFQLHYSANPVKKDPSYRDSIKSSMPIRQYLQEYELQWDSFEGKPVYADWNQSIHGSKEKLYPTMGLPLLRSWDFGLTPACVIGQYVNDKLLVFREFVESNMGADRFSRMVMNELNTLYPHWSRDDDWIDFIDPSGNFRKDTNEDTCASILKQNGVKRIIPGPVAFEPRRQAVEDFLTRYLKDGPCFQIDMARCPVLIRGFNGGYRYSEKSFEIEPNKIRPIKDEHSHPHDALQYLASGIIKIRLKRKVSIGVPSYSWMKKAEKDTSANG